jgi:hypothetical protein
MSEQRRARGRPLKFESPEQLLEKAEEWFGMTPINQQTITGLAVYLDTSRETLMNYEKRDDLFDAVKKVKDRIEYSYELTLRTRGSAGDIFGLKNFGWQDRSEVENSGETKVIVETRQAKRLEVPSKVIEHVPDDNQD